MSLMRLHHYLGDRLPSGETVRQVALWSGTPIAIIEWSSASLYNGPRDRWIDWDQEKKARRLHLVANNSRFLMLPTTAEIGTPNLASRVLSASLRRLSPDFVVVYGHPIYLAETFVDASRFRGTCYRASNWLDVGETSGWSKRGDDYHFHGQKKVVFLFPLNRRSRIWLGGRDCPREIVTRMGTTLPLDFTKLNIEGSGGLIEVFRAMTDPRMPRGVRHPVIGLLALGATAVMAGYRSFQAFGEWAENLPKEIRARLGSTWPKPPTESTFRRVFAKINVEEFETRTAAWIAKHQDLKSRAIAIDGKTLRGSGEGDSKPTHLVSAVTHDDGVVIAQVRTSLELGSLTTGVQVTVLAPGTVRVMLSAVGVKLTVEASPITAVPVRCQYPVCPANADVVMLEFHLISKLQVLLTKSMLVQVPVAARLVLYTLLGFVPCRKLVPFHSTYQPPKSPVRAPLRSSNVIFGTPVGLLSAPAAEGAVKVVTGTRKKLNLVSEGP